MEVKNLQYPVTDFEIELYTLLVENSLVAQRSLLSLLLLVIELLPNHNTTPMDVTRQDQRFLVAELREVKEPAAENKDASETGENDYSEDDVDDLDDDEEDDDSDEDSDDDELVDSDDDDDDDDSGINENDSDDEDDDDGDDDDEDDSDDDDDEDDEEDDDEDEDEDL